MEWLFILVGVPVGIAVEYARSKTTSRTEPIGTLRIETSDPDGPFMFLELYKEIGDFLKEKQVVLDVSTENYISQD